MADRFAIKTATMALVEHAKEAYPNECCGLIVKRCDDYVYIRSKNLAEDPARAFLLDPELVEQHAGQISFIAHSHVHGDSTPSDSDKANSERCGIPFLIVSYPDITFNTYRPEGYEQPYEGRIFLYGASDCFTLVRDFYAREFDIALEDRRRDDTMWWENKDIQYSSLDDLKSMGFVKVPEPQYGDVLLMRLRSLQPNHMAIYLGDNIILHQYYGKPSLKEMYGSYWRKVTDHVVRHQGKMEHADVRE